MIRSYTVIPPPRPIAHSEDLLALRAGRMRALAGLARAALDAIGLMSVVALLLLVTAPGLRLPFAHLGSAFWATEDADTIEEAAGEDADPQDSAAPHIGQRVFLDAAQSNVALYLARRYRVADDAVRVMVAAAQSSGKEQQIDPLLILAVVAVESSMNPFAQSPVGATGLMQVMPGLHGGKFGQAGAAERALDPVANIRVGSQILGDVIRRGGSVERGLQLYVGAGNMADDGGYAVRVLAEFSRLRLAAAGGVTAALAAGLRADSRATSAIGADP